MIIRDYISQKLSSLGVTLTEADFIDISLTQKIDINSDITQENKALADTAYVQQIPKILSMPDVGEGGMSIRWDRASLRQHYDMMCRQLNLNNTLKPRVIIR